jgi:ATP-dependent DNA helicase RecG
VTLPLALADLDEIPVDRLNGVGGQRRQALSEVNIHSVFDLITYYPRRYIDRSKEAPIGDCVIGEQIMVVGEITKVTSRSTRNRKSLVEAIISDGTGTVRATFFNQAWRKKQLLEGLTVALFGKIDEYRGAKQMTNPLIDFVGDKTGRIVAVYPQSEKAGLVSWELARWITEALRRCEERGIEDPVPESVRLEYGLLSRHDALRMIHEPAELSDVQKARNRLVFDELLRVQLTLRLSKLHREGAVRGIEHDLDKSLSTAFFASLPFELTGAQKRAVRQINTDISKARPMHRLLQGDVGSGKTLVAFQGLINAVANGHQGAFMAPTEILAEQHYMGLREMAEGFEVPDSQTLTGVRPLSIKLLSNSVPAPEKKRIIRQLKDGSVDVAVGTHSLIQSGVSFKSLSFVVIDEQHRFGVEQRAKLREHSREDGRWPHLLVMTATPIPRTAAMTVYGDLDVSVLDELPPGRIPIETKWVSTPEAVKSAWSYVREEVKGGRQTFVVCPLIDESENLVASSAEATYAELMRGELSGLRVGLLHGRLKASDKERAMEQFRVGLLDVLVATTVIEVGVNIPNASAMVVLSADRFGIAQLHQLRGRVGRSSYKSRCYLVTEDSVTEDAVHRLQALENSTDGFELAEVDLELRGEGTIFDQHQSGRSDLKLASLTRDRLWVERARSCSEALVEGHGTITSNPMLGKEIDWFISARGPDAQNLWRG